MMPFSDSLALPHAPGHEICGRVLECDPADGFAPGDRVVVYNVWPCGRCDRCQAGEEHKAGDVVGRLVLRVSGEDGAR